MTEKELNISNLKWGGVDLLKILACIGVLAYHVLDDTFAFQNGQTVARILYFAASYCVPMFFTVSGYTYGRSSFSMEYIEQKVLGILKKLFGWIIFWCVIYAFVYHEEHNPYIELIDGSFSGGVLPVSWFIFTLCLCWLFGWIFFNLRQKSSKIFYAVALLFLILMLIKRSHLISVDIPFYDTGTQATWFLLYLTFFLTGIVLRDIQYIIIREKWVYKIGIVTATIIMTAVYVKMSSISGLSPADYYGHWVYMIWFILLFITAMNVCPYKNWLHTLSKGTFSVYMWHLPVLLYITRYIPVTDAKRGLLMILLLFISGQAVYFLFRNYPLLRKMV